MADTYTTNLNLTKPEPGAAEDTWGISLNADLDALDAIFSTSGTQINLNPNQINFADNKKAIFGTGNDFGIKHDGSHTYLQNSTGHVYFQQLADDSRIVFQSDNGSGGVATYFFIDGDQQNTNFQKDAVFADSVKATFGTGNDLQIYHNGTHSYIDDAGTGNLYIRASQSIALQKADGTEDYLTANNNGAVTLYHNNSPKIATTSSGIDVTGNIELGSSHFMGDEGGAGQSENLYIKSSENNDVIIRAGVDSNSIRLQTSATDRFTIDAGGVGYWNGTSYIDSARNLSNLGTISSGAITSTGNSQMANLVVTGDLTVQGTTTSVNTDDLNVKDKNITLNYSTGDSSASANGAGITIQDAVSSTQDATLTWNTANDSFNFSHPLNVTGNISSSADVSAQTFTVNSSGYGSIEVGGVSGAFIDLKRPSTDDYDLRLISFGTGGEIDTGSGDLVIKRQGSPKLATTSSGIDVTGTVTSDGLTVEAGIAQLQLIDTGVSGSTKLRTANAQTWLEVDPDNVQASSGFATYIDGKRFFNIEDTGDISFYEDTGTTAKFFWDASAERLGLGTTSPSAALHISGTSADQIRLERTNHDTFRIGLQSAAGLGFHNVTDNRTDMMIKGDGSVGIGTSTPSASKLTVQGDIRIRDSIASLFLQDTDGTNQVSEVKQSAGITTISSRNNTSNGAILFTGYNGSATTEYARFNSSGNLGIGTSSPSFSLDVRTADNNVAQFKSTDASATVFIADNASSSAIRNNLGVLTLSADEGDTSSGTAIVFQTDTAERARITSNGNVGIGTASPADKLTVNGTINHTNSLDVYKIFSTGSGLIYAGSTSSSSVAFITGGGEKARLDTSGNLLIGTTSTTPAFGTGNGTAIRTGEMSHISRSGGTALALNRASSDGDIVSLRKDGTQVGSIGNNTDFYIASQDGTGLRFTNNQILPCSESGAIQNTSRDLGSSTGKFKDLHLSGTGYFGTSVGIGTTSPSEKIQINDGRLRFWESGQRQYNIGIASGTSKFQIYDATFSYAPLTIDGTGKVGIGTDTPNTILEIASGNSGGDAALNSPTFRINNTTESADWDVGDVVGAIEYYTSDASGNAPYVASFIKSVNETGNGTLPDGALTFGTATYNASGGASERMRIDSSGNLLVATTDTTLLNNTSGGGFSVSSNGFTQIAKQGVDSADPVLILNQTGVEGEILRFYKDGGIVGSIGTDASRFKVKSNSVALYLENESNKKLVWGNVSGVPYFYPHSDNDTNIGYPTQRFKDLYLSGTANFGSLSDGTITITGFVDEDNMSSDSATLLPTQQSVKAYVDANSFTINNNADNRIITGTANAGTLNAETTLTYGTTGADLHITGGSIGGVPPILRLEDVGSSGKLAELNHIAGTTTLISRNATSNGVIKFAGHNGTSETEYARIDSSGNLFVNQTATGDYTDTAGSSFRATGFSTHTRDGGDVLLLNRLSSDGNILLFRKDNSTVGSIGTNSGALYISSPYGNDSGLRFVSGIIAPATTTGANRDAAIDLGYSSGRFKDLYLSGNIVTSTISANGDITLTEGDKIKTSESSGGSHLLLRSDNLGVTSNSLSLIGVNDVLIGAKSNQSGTGNIYFGYNAESKATGSGWVDTLTILDSGNVGIGTTSPAKKLQVSTSSDLDGITIENTYTANHTSKRPRLFFKGTDTVGTSKEAAIIQMTPEDPNNVASALSFYTRTSDSTTEKVRITGSGNVGIGTSSPQQALTVTTSSAYQGIHINGSAAPSLCFDRYTGTTPEWKVGISGNNGDNFGISTGAANADKLVITPSGNVGIGISSPQERLQVYNSSGTDVLTVTAATATANTTGASLLFRNLSSSATGAISKIGIETGSAIDRGSLVFSTSSSSNSPTERMRIDSSGKLFLNSTSVTAGYTGAHLIVGGQTSPLIKLQSTHGTPSAWDIYTSSGTSLIFARNQSDKVAITSAGRLGVGTTSPSEKLHVLGNTKITGTITVGASHTIGDDGQTDDFVIKSSEGNNLILKAGVDSDSLILKTTNTALTINPEGKSTFAEDATFSGKVGIGTSSPSNKLDIKGTVGFEATNSTNRWLAYTYTDNTLRLNYNGAGADEVTINSSGNVGIGTDNPADKLTVNGNIAIGGGKIFNGSASNSAGVSLPNSTVRIDGYNGITFHSSTTTVGSQTERMRIDSSGNLLVGTTDSNVTNNTGNNPGINIGVAGIKGYIAAARYQGAPLALNRLNNDGEVAVFTKDGSTGGVIGIQEPQDNAPELYIANGTTTGSTGLAFWNYISPVRRIAPCDGAGSYVDNAIDLGWSNARFDDIYATNGTIQTSDRNEKQDIQALTEAEQRVATACKGLIRRFRWQDSVAEKDDNPDSDETARLHFGVIAQDLQDAFEAEGLDAGDYGMFISSTWEDDDGNEQTRLGVRYNELLAFIITTL